VVICLERGADLHMAQLMPLPLIVPCFSKIQIDFTFLVPAHPVALEKGPLNGCVCVCVCGVRPSTYESKFFLPHNIGLGLSLMTLSSEPLFWP